MWKHRDRETDHLRACVVAWLCQGCVGTCSSWVLTLSPAAPEGPKAFYGGLREGRLNEMTAPFVTFVALSGMVKDRLVQKVSIELWIEEEKKCTQFSHWHFQFCLHPDVMELSQVLFLVLTAMKSTKHTVNSFIVNISLVESSSNENWWQWGQWIAALF